MPDNLKTEINSTDQEYSLDFYECYLEGKRPHWYSFYTNPFEMNFYENGEMAFQIEPNGKCNLWELPPRFTVIDQVGNVVAIIREIKDETFCYKAEFTNLNCTLKMKKGQFFNVEFTLNWEFTSVGILRRKPIIIFKEWEILPELRRSRVSFYARSSENRNSVIPLIISYFCKIFRDRLLKSDL